MKDYFNQEFTGPAASETTSSAALACRGTAVFYNYQAVHRRLPSANPNAAYPLVKLIYRPEDQTTSLIHQLFDRVLLDRSTTHKETHAGRARRILPSLRSRESDFFHSPQN